MHILSAEQFNQTQIEKIFARADYFRRQKSPLQRQKLVDLHKGRQVCTVFFQPSTRTRLSFEVAAAKMGIGVVSTENAREHSSSAKGESLEDAIRVLNQYEFDIIVMRHHEIGAAKQAAAVSQTPIINAGDGAGEHPTQALLDVYTIYRLLGRLDNLKVVFGGDIERSRTIKSLVDVLAKYKNNSFTFVAPKEIKLRADVKKSLTQKNIKFEQTSKVEKALKDADVIYWSRLQTEYLNKPGRLAKKNLVIDKTILKNAPKKSIIMHALPRVDEIHPEVDDDPRAKYFEQASNGLYIRMALLDLILRGSL